jgi:hypothetical protein
MMQVQNRVVESDIQVDPPVEQLNRYSVLEDQELELNEENNGFEENVDVQRNMENFTEVVDDSSGEETDFIDATHEDKEDSSSESSSADQEIVHERVQKDMQFLKDSWANIAENENAEIRLLADLETDQPNLEDASASFQVFQSKRNSKKQKQTSSKNAYSTRSKVSQAKHF